MRTCPGCVYPGMPFLREGWRTQGTWGVGSREGGQMESRCSTVPSTHQLLELAKKQKLRASLDCPLLLGRSPPTSIDYPQARHQLPCSLTDTARLPAPGFRRTQLGLQYWKLGLFLPAATVGKSLFYVPLGGLGGCSRQLLEFAILREGHHTVCRNGSWG